MANVKLLQYDGSEKIYTGVRKVLLGTSNGGTALYSEGQAVEGVPIVPDFSQGDMTVETPEGILVKSAIIQKPENLIPGNIRRGTTVAGVTGELIGDTEEVTVDLDFTSVEDPQVVSDMVINPTAEGKVISQVTVRKPDTLIPENIAKDVDIAGITGTLEIPESLENIPIALDFSDGDQTITAPDGMVVKSAIIQKPENLLPENIAEGVDIAGIIGTLIAGAGSGGAKFATGYFTGRDAPETIEHGLGTVPDFVMVAATAFNTSTTDRLFFAYSTSTAMGKALPGLNGSLEWGQYYTIAKSGSSYKLGRMSHAGAIDTTSTFGIAIRCATDTSFDVGPSGYYQIPSSTCGYMWLAIAGLT